jgi:hypothetical protein
MTELGMTELAVTELARAELKHAPIEPNTIDITTTNRTMDCLLCECEPQGPSRVRGTRKCDYSARGLHPS